MIAFHPQLSERAFQLGEACKPLLGPTTNKYIPDCYKYLPSMAANTPKTMSSRLMTMKVDSPLLRV